MKRNLVDQTQPFGQVEERREHPEYMGGSDGVKSKGLGAKTEIENHGRDHAESFADQGAGAKAFASRNKDNPFYPTGHPRKG